MSGLQWYAAPNRDYCTFDCAAASVGSDGSSRNVSRWEREPTLAADRCRRQAGAERLGWHGVAAWGGAAGEHDAGRARRKPEVLLMGAARSGLFEPPAGHANVQ